jgi:hypothetical protein
MTKQTLRTFIFCFFLSAFGGNAFAQISIGVRGGLTINTLAIDPLIEGESTPKSVPGFQAAIPIEIGIGEIFAIQPEIMFGSHGVEREASDSGTLFGVTTSVRVNSKGLVNALEIPVLGKAKFGSETLKFFVLAGPSVGLGLGGESTTESYTKVEFGGAVVSESSSNEKLKPVFVNDGYENSEVDSDEFPVVPLNFNLHAGAGVAIDLDILSIVLEGRYILGLNDLLPDPAGTADADKTTWKSRRIGFSAGIMFPLN